MPFTIRTARGWTPFATNAKRGGWMRLATHARASFSLGPTRTAACARWGTADGGAVKSATVMTASGTAAARATAAGAGTASLNAQQTNS